MNKNSGLSCRELLSLAWQPAVFMCNNDKTLSLKRLSILIRYKRGAVNDGGLVNAGFSGSDIVTLDGYL